MIFALAGNQNCGKTTLFNALTGSSQYVGNWPGVTVEKKEGKLKSNKDVIWVSAFDNGDARGMEQPPLPDMKYSRSVIYKIDQKKKTVQQVWEYGKEKGHDWYSPVTSLTQYEGDKDSVMVYSATPQMQLVAGKAVGAPSPYLMEFNWGAKEPAVEIRINGSMGYQAMPFRVNKAFNHTGK